MEDTKIIDLYFARDELSDCIPAPGGVEEPLQMKELTLAIRAFLDTQKEREQNIFLRRYREYPFPEPSCGCADRHFGNGERHDF